MNTPEIQIFPDVPALSHAAARRITATLQRAVERRQRASLVLTGGNTPRPVYEILSEVPYRAEMPWRQIDFFWGDERCVPPDSPESNYGMTWSTLLSRVPIAENRIHRISGELGNPEEAALRYEAEIRRVEPHVTSPEFDLVLLGMGEDGHVASLFPGTRWDQDRWVVANYVPRLDTTRITMTPRLLNRARQILFLVTGSGKASTLAKVLGNSETDFPARLIQPSSGTLTFMIDEAAASLLGTASLGPARTRTKTDQQIR